MTSRTTWKRSATIRALGKCLCTSARYTRQIHADEADQVLALEAIQIAFQRCFAATEHHIMDAMTSEIAEGSGKSVTARKEVLIDAEHLCAGGIAPFL